jgi:hypothetical protein
MMFEKDIPTSFPVPGTPVWVQASIKKLPDGTVMRMKVERVLTIEEIRQQAVKSYTVSINMRQGASVIADPKPALNNLAKMASQNRGPAKLRIELDYPDSKVVLNAADGVELTNSFIRSIRSAGLSGRYE